MHLKKIVRTFQNVKTAIIRRYGTSQYPGIDIIGFKDVKEGNEKVLISRTTYPENPANNQRERVPHTKIMICRSRFSDDFPYAQAGVQEVSVPLTDEQYNRVKKMQEEGESVFLIAIDWRIQHILQNKDFDDEKKRNEITKLQLDNEWNTLALNMRPKDEFIRFTVADDEKHAEQVEKDRLVHAENAATEIHRLKEENKQNTSSQSPSISTVMSHG